MSNNEHPIFLVETQQ